MAPPQSYLDFSTPRFSRYVNLTYPTRVWHAEFSYYGANVYAYLLSLHGESIDFVSIQLYESYSRAAYETFQLGVKPSSYLTRLIADHVGRGESFFVHFSDDAETGLTSRNVQLPVSSKLVIGLANGWARPDKVVYFSPYDIEQTLSDLRNAGLPVPRGFMFWAIDLEGENGIYLAEGLQKAMEDRTNGNRNDGQVGSESAL